jgi:hypothetical protein
VFSSLRKAKPPVSAYENLFEFDERRLREASGAPLLDAFIRVLTGAWLSTRVGSLPEARAILSSDAKTRGDIFARLCLAVSSPDERWANKFASGKDRETLEALKKALEGHRDMILPGREAFAILSRDHRVRTTGYIGSYERGSLLMLVRDAPKLLEMVVNAREEKVDPDLAKLLEATLSRVRDQYPQNSEILSALPLVLLALDCLRRPPDQFEPARCYLEGKRATQEWLESWRGVLHPLLVDYIHAAADPSSARNQPRLQALADEAGRLSPEERAEIVAQMRRVARDVVRRPTPAPWTFHDFLNDGRALGSVHLRSYYEHGFRVMWEAVIARPCRFSPDQALDFLATMNPHRSPAALAFAKSVAAALPRTQEARKAVEGFASRLETAAASAASRRNRQKQAALLLAAVKADGADIQTLDQRHATAVAAFEAAFETVWSADLAARERAKANGSEVARLLRVMSPNSPDSVLQGPSSRRELLVLFGAVIKAGPAPEACLRKLDKIEKGLEAARLIRQIEIPRGAPELRTRAPWLYEDYLGVEQTRAFIVLFAPLSPAAREAWLALEAFAATSPDTAKPSGAWSKAAQTLALAFDPAARTLLFELMDLPYFAAAGPGNLKPLLGHNQTVKRAFVWLCALLPAREAVKPLTSLALRAFASHPQGGITNEILGNACLWSLSRLGAGAGLPALARIGARVRYPKVRQRINALFEEAARKAGRPRAEIEEEIAPHHGFDPQGVSTLALHDGMGRAEIQLDDHGKAKVVWRDEAGKALKAPSTKMKERDAAGIKGARDAIKEIEADHAVEVKRVERLYRQTRALDFGRWREFYGEHPFAGQICRRLIWRAETPQGAVAGLWRGGAFEDVTGRSRDISAARMTLWHPLDADEAEIAAWRDRLAALGVNQPFRQAWRETYRVTGAERATGAYSNRFAGHIVRQHQFMTLARLNDWSVRHRMWQDVSNDEPTYYILPEFGVYAEYWTAGAGGEDPPVAESTAYLYLSTDRVVFHHLNAAAPPNKPFELRGAPMRAEDVPPRAFSEIMRCCDLFVAVASIAGDPNWLDRGAEARHPNQWQTQADAYWRDAATASLSANAETRRELLARWLPALDLQDRLSLDERFLHVKGVRGAYRVHLGSAAAFRGDGRHICIVPDGAPKKLVLPFEGDDVLAKILSKAMLLSRDDKIVDPVILRQL